MCFTDRARVDGEKVYIVDTGSVSVTNFLKLLVTLHHIKKISKCFYLIKDGVYD